MNKPRRRRFRLWIASGAIFLLVGCLRATILLREPRLRDHAKRVLELHAGDQSEMPNYGWLSDHELLFFRSDGSLHRLDTATGVCTDLPVLDRQIRSLGRSGGHWLETSPDGKWVMWGQSSGKRLFVTSLDGTTQFSWPVSPEGTITYWLPDSQHWMERRTPIMKAYEQAVVHSLHVPHAKESYQFLPDGMGPLEIVAVQSEERIVARAADLERWYGPISTGGGKISAEGQQVFRDTQELSIWSLHTAKPLQQFTMHLPGPVREVRLSPQGDRLAWLVETPTVSSIAKWLQRWIPAWKRNGGQDPTSLSLWVSRLDGSQLREIGRASIDLPSNHGILWNIGWLPGGRNLCFVQDDVVWTVQAD